MTADLRAQTLTRAVVQLTTGGESSGWRNDAACAEVDPVLFDPKKKGEGTYEDARKICAGCDVREQCLRWAIEHDEHGIWGGLTRNERRELTGTKGERRLKEILHGAGAAGAAAHRRRGETVCPECLASEARVKREGKDRRRAQQVAARMARHEAAAR